MSRYEFDVETDGLLPELTTIHSLVIKNVDDPKDYHSCAHDPMHESIESGLKILAEADEIIGHNILKFDLPAIKKVYPNWKTKAKLTDTFVISKLIWTELKQNDFRYRKRVPTFPGQMIGRHSLEAWGFRLGVLKGDYGKTTDWSEWTPSMQEYCEQDVEVTDKLREKIESKNYSTEAIQLEHDFQVLMFMQEQHGFYFDQESAQKLAAELSGRREELRQKLTKRFKPRVVQMKKPAHYKLIFMGPPLEEFKFPTKGAAEKFRKMKKWKPSEVSIEPGPLAVKEIPFNPTSRDHIADRLREDYGWKPTKFTNDGKPVVDEAVLNRLEFPEAKDLAECFMLTKRLGQLSEGKVAWLRYVQDDGRIHGQVNTNGAVTGRCTHNKPNMAQVPKHPQPYGAECRGLFTVPEGKVLVGADASGLELRCLAHYMAKWDGGEYANELLTGDIHTMNQKAAGLSTRDQAKTFIYALIYGAGDGKIGSIVGGSKKDGEELKKKFFAALPALDNFITAVKRSCGFFPIEKKDGTVFWKRDESAKKTWLVGLDGRLLLIRSAHAAPNTLLQSAGALVMKKAICLHYEEMVRRGYTHGKEFAYVANVHDEAQQEADPDVAEETGQLFCDSIEAAGVLFKFRCPLAGEYKIGRTWHETH